MPTPSRPVLFHIPVCPFSQRLEILLALKGARDAVDFHVVDITKPRPDWLLAKTEGRTALPVLETTDGVILRESLVLLRYLDATVPGRSIGERDPTRRALEEMIVALAERDLVASGYELLMNQDVGRRDALRERLLSQYAVLDAFLRRHSPDGTFLFEAFGWAEAVFTPMFMRFWCLPYYEGFELPERGFERVRTWERACLAHPAAQQVTHGEIVKSYYDYARGAGNGALVAGRSRSSFTFEPHWSTRPMPPRDKYGRGATDAELGL